jgi:hypothetical protein
MGVKLLGIASTYPPPPNPLSPGEGEICRGAPVCVPNLRADTWVRPYKR